MPPEPEVQNKFSANIHSLQMQSCDLNFIDSALQKISDEICALEVHGQQKAHFTEQVEKEVDEVLSKSIQSLLSNSKDQAQQVV